MPMAQAETSAWDCHEQCVARGRCAELNLRLLVVDRCRGLATERARACVLGGSSSSSGATSNYHLRGEVELSRNRKGLSMAAAAGQGIINTPRHHSVNQTVEKVKGILRAKGVTLFALIDHSGEAEKAGMEMPPTKLLIFGSPQAGTPLMLAVP